METLKIDAGLFHALVRAGSENLKIHAAEVNDLNVFPIPDGDTGDNMLLTMQGGATVEMRDGDGVGAIARKIADGMLLSARGNSGVILSQFFDGIAAGLSGASEADAELLGRAFARGVEHSYAAVMQPTEGTILTVAKEATDYAVTQYADTPAEFLDRFLEQANVTLANTPELLPVLKKAGVVDSGGAGLIYIVQGMAGVLNGEMTPVHTEPPAASAAPKTSLNLDLFTPDSVLEFGYCTELLLRLQNAKTDIDAFDVAEIRDYLQTIGDSIVAFQTGSIVKLHVHTMTPYKVLEFCQRYGEYLTVKIENMSLQHNNLPADSALVEQKERSAYGVVAVASGEGIKQTFRDMGVDVIVDGGQCMNPSADDFIEAFDRANADTILVLPNNGNVILAARQAAKLYDKSDVRVLDSRTIGEGYAALTMLTTDSGDTDAIVAELTEAMQGVVMASVSRCSRETEMDGFSLHEGDYIGFSDKDIISADKDRRDTACMLSDRLDFDGREICILIRGTDSDAGEAEEIAEHIRFAHRGCEVFIIDGGQEIYSYILIIE